MDDDDTCCVDFNNKSCKNKKTTSRLRRSFGNMLRRSFTGGRNKSSSSSSSNTSPRSSKLVDIAIENYMREQCQREEKYDLYRPRVPHPELEALWQEAVGDSSSESEDEELFD